MTSSIYFTAMEAALMLAKDVTTVRDCCRDGRLTAEVQRGTRGAGGITYRIPLDALPVEAQVRYWMSRDSTEAGDADIAGYR